MENKNKLVEQVFAIYDNKVGGFNKPFVLKNKAEAERVLRQTLQGSDTLLARFPQDYNLYILGELDMISGKGEIYSEKVDCGNLSQFLSATEGDSIDGLSADISE